MGYSTSFTGRLDFTRELKGSELAMLVNIFKEDCRDHTDWPDMGYECYFKLELTGDMTGIQWSGMEKASSMEFVINCVIEIMRREVPDFGLTGHFNAQGEDIDDRWTLTMKGGKAYRVECPMSGHAVICPHCELKVYVDEAEPWVEL